MKLSARWILLSVLVLALIAGAVRAISVKRQQAQAAASTVQVQNQIELRASDVLRVEPRELIQSLPITGTIKAVHFAAIKARVAGEVKAFTVREGDAVKAGQVLARIDPVEYQNRWEQAREQADAARAQMDIAQRQWDTNQALVAQGFIAKVALDNSQASLQAAQASYRAAVAGAEVARKALDDASLRAPFDGVVASRLAQAGERVGVDVKLLELVDPSQLEVEVALSASDSVDVRIGQVAQLQVEDRPDTLTARVKRISPSAQAGSRSVLVFLALDAQPGLRHGLFVKGTLGTTQSRVLAVPLEAIRTDRARPYVQAVADGQVVHRPVEMGLRGTEVNGRDANPIWVAVQGLNEGDTVLQGQLGPLREGLRVIQSGERKP
jgi:multidrug efflux system membrane fusion protein